MPQSVGSPAGIRKTTLSQGSLLPLPDHSQLSVRLHTHAQMHAKSAAPRNQGRRRLEKARASARPCEFLYTYTNKRPHGSRAADSSEDCTKSRTFLTSVRRREAVQWPLGLARADTDTRNQNGRPFWSMQMRMGVRASKTRDSPGIPSPAECSSGEPPAGLYLKTGNGGPSPDAGTGTHTYMHFYRPTVRERRRRQGKAWRRLPRRACPRRQLRDKKPADRQCRWLQNTHGVTSSLQTVKHRMQKAGRQHTFPQ